MKRVSGDAIVPARDAHGLAFQQSLDDDNRLRQSLDARGAGVEGEPHLRVLGLHVAGADAQLEPAVAQHVERRGLARGEQGMAEIVVEHAGPDTQPGRRRGRGGERGKRREQLGQVVRDEQNGIAETLDLARFVGPLGRRARRPDVDAEPERPHHQLRGRDRATVRNYFQTTFFPNRSPNR